MVNYRLPNPIHLHTLDMLSELQKIDTFKNRDIRRIFNISCTDASMRLARLRAWGLIVPVNKSATCREYQLTDYGNRFKRDNTE